MPSQALRHGTKGQKPYGGSRIAHKGDATLATLICDACDACDTDLRRLRHMRHFKLRQSRQLATGRKACDGVIKPFFSKLSPAQTQRKSLRRQKLFRIDLARNFMVSPVGCTLPQSLGSAIRM